MTPNRENFSGNSHFIDDAAQGTEIGEIGEHIFLFVTFNNREFPCKITCKTGYWFI